MTMREKVAWISVLTTIVVWSYYFWTVWADFSARSLDGDALFWRFVWCIGFTFVLMMGLTVLASILGKQPFEEPQDERERQLHGRANRIGLATLELSMVGLILGSGWIADIARADFAADPAGATVLMMINAMLFLMVIAAALREVLLIVQFRLMD
jgi:hypothetical protein